MSPWLLLIGPNLAVLMLGTGGLLICLEFNRPGTIVPLSTGTFLVLMAGFRLSQMPARWWAVVLLFLSLACMLGDIRMQARWMLAGPGCVCLVASLRYLVTSPQVEWTSAIVAGGIFSVVLVVLGKIGERARRAKLLPTARAE